MIVKNTHEDEKGYAPKVESITLPETRTYSKKDTDRRRSVERKSLSSLFTAHAYMASSSKPIENRSDIV
jgi:hypothetical protein